MPYDARLLLFDRESRCYLVHNTPDNPGHTLAPEDYLNKVIKLVPQPYLFVILWYEKLVTWAQVDEGASQTVRIYQQEISDDLTVLKPDGALTMCPLETGIFAYETELWRKAIDGADSLDSAREEYMRQPHIDITKRADLSKIE